jgi:hypothetical protein
MRRSASWWLPALAAIAAILMRLPFLLRGAAYFNSDEAIEGLMVRHIHEWPIFYWGQGYKGVPEVYLAWPVFAIFGPSIIALKSVTLVLWAIAVGTLTRLGQRWYDDATAAIAAVLLITGPPALAFWSLSANAEVVWLTMVIGAMLLLYQRTVDAPGTPVSRLVFVLAGFAVWIHPVSICAIAALCALAALRSAWWRDQGWRGVGRVLSGRAYAAPFCAIVWLLQAVALVAALVFLVTFLGANLQLGLFTASHPQKVLREFVVVAGCCVLIHALSGVVVPRRAAMAALGWTALGAMPVLLQVLRRGPVGAPIMDRTAADIPVMLAGLVHTVVPVVMGMRDESLMPLGVPWWLAAAFVVALGLQVGATRRAWWSALRGRAAAYRPDEVFIVLLGICVLGLLIPGAAYQDAHSNRYVMPFYGLLVLSAAAGLRRLAAWHRGAAIAVGAACLLAYGMGQYRWYEQRRPDPSDRLIADCLVEHGIHAATADYWVAYRMTFLSDERVIVSAGQGDRYPPYYTLAHASPVRIEQVSAPTTAGSVVLCSSPSLVAVRQSR